jgi:sialate O-acetylesterase
MLRQFLIKETASPVPKADCVGKWMIAGPDTYAQFTAVGYYFGKSLQQKLKTPIGLINASYGGSTVEAWISTAGFKGDSELNAGMDKLCGDTGSYPQRQKDYVKQYHAWAAKYGREDHPAADTQAFTAAKIPPEGWKPVSMPGTLATAGLPDAGAVWLRKTVTVPGGLAHHGLVMNLALPRDFDAVYYDGIKIASTTPDATTSRNFIASFSNARRCDVPDTAVKAGESVFAIRLFNPAGGIGIGPNYAKLAAGNLNLNGEWLAKAEYELPPLSPEAKSSYPQMPLMPPNVRDLGSYLFNAMINPIIPYGIKGEIWYQGESNISRGFQYRTAFSLLIQDWRSLWKRGDFPVYYCQLPNYSTKETTPGESDMAEMREAQSMALKLPNTGQAVLIDIGEEGDIHCRDKADVGDRLARLALAKTYGQAIDYSGPVYRSMSVEGKTARIRFDFANKLTARALPATYQPRSGDPATKPTVRNSSDSELEGFAICGGDHRFVWANAKIDGNTVVVSSLAVENPVAVRYAWADDPTCNLYNGAGLPASPFRTDDFPAHTLLAHYGL